MTIPDMESGGGTKISHGGLDIWKKYCLQCPAGLFGLAWNQAMSMYTLPKFKAIKRFYEK